MEKEGGSPVLEKREEQKKKLQIDLEEN